MENSNIKILGPALCVVFSPRDYLSAPRQELVLNFNLKVHPPIFMWGEVGCGSCCFLGGEMPALSLLGGPTLQILAPAFPKLEPGLGRLTVLCFPVPNRFTVSCPPDRF